MNDNLIAFGPVPSRRLGNSLGINNIPPKVCTYSCAYCQVGVTEKKKVERAPYYEPEVIRRRVEERFEAVTRRGQRVDFVTFVPDGEPTLDASLSREIELLRPLGTPIAIISNASLIGQEDVRDDLMRANWVSLKVDSTRESVWRRINRPHPSLRLSSILDGMRSFARAFRGELVVETMLVKGFNDDEELIEELACFLASLRPSKAYLSVPTRPPALRSAEPPDEADVMRAYSLLNDRVDGVECLLGYEGNRFACGGDVEEDLLGITAVHPMREDAVLDLLNRADADWSVVERLLVSGRLTQTDYRGSRFYMRVLPKSSGGSNTRRVASE